MGSHPANLAVRFLLEIAALVSTGIWGWNLTEDWLRFFLAIGIPVVLAAIWGTFAVPDDPSRSGKAPIKTPGIIRLILEIAIFILAVWSLYDLGFARCSLAMGLATFLHYSLSYDRIIWLISSKKN